MLLAEPIDVRIETPGKKVLFGTATSRESGSVVFVPSGTTQPVRVLDSQIADIKLPANSDEEADATRLFDDGQYSLANEKLDALLAPYEEYASLPSNLRPAFLQWMIVSYWAGHTDRVLQLAEALANDETPEVQTPVRFYSGLARFENGDIQGMDTFLKSPAGAEIYPPKSAARLYMEARILQNQGHYISAIRTAALLLALHSRDADWMPKAELLCAEIYFQLDMPESARSALDDIKEFYSNPEIQQQAAAIAAGK
jgi:hypothetical protein